jgi:hypothetical protein
VPCHGKHGSLCQNFIVQPILGSVWLPADGATPRLRCGGRFGRHTGGARCVAWRGVRGRQPNTPLVCAPAMHGKLFEICSLFIILILIDSLSRVLARRILWTATLNLEPLECETRACMSVGFYPYPHPCSTFFSPSPQTIGIVGVALDLNSTLRATSLGRS